MYKIRIDPEKELGAIRDMHGVGGGPVSDNFLYDSSELFRNAGIPFCRTHDIEYPFGKGGIRGHPLHLPRFHTGRERPGKL